MDELKPITATVREVPTIAEAKTVAERIAALQEQADQLEWDVRELKCEADKMSDYEDGDVLILMKEALKSAGILSLALDKAKDEAEKKVD